MADTAADSFPASDNPDENQHNNQQRHPDRAGGDETDDQICQCVTYGFCIFQEFPFDLLTDGLRFYRGEGNHFINVEIDGTVGNLIVSLDSMDSSS